jgi:hypothetical protein
MKTTLLLLVLLGAWSCAPLTPSPEVPAVASAPQPGAAPTTALEAYLARRRGAEDSTAVARPWIAVLPFVDASGFRKDLWDLGLEMSRLVAAEMAAYPDWQVVPSQAVEEAVGADAERDLTPGLAVACVRSLAVDLVLQGTVADFNMGRFTAGDPLLGGYKSYTGTAKLRATATRCADGGVVGEVTADREVVNRDLGLDLLGKPREQDVLFAGLAGTRFGSPEFRATVVGKATMEAVGQLLQDLVALTSPQGLEVKGRLPEVLSVYGEDVYINLGSEDRVRAGYCFEVVAGPQRVREEGEDPHRVLGVVVVKEVIGARLSSVRVLRGAGSFGQGDRLQLAPTHPAAQ